MGTLNGFWPKCEDVILGFHYQDAKSCGHSTTHIGSKAGGPMWTTHLLFGWYPILASGNQTWLENPGTKCKFLADHVPVVPARGGAEVALGIYIYNTFLIYRTCMRRAPARPVRACFLRKWCSVSHVRFEAPLHTSHFSLHSSRSTLHTPHFTLRTSHSTLFTLHSSHSTLHTSHCTLHTPHFTLHTALFAQTTSQYYCVLQNLHKLLPSTTLHYQACTNYFPILLCITKLTQTSSQYYFALQSLHKLLPNIILYCMVCTNYFPILLYTTKLAQTTSQYYFALQSLHKLLPSTTLYYKACTNYFPVLLCTTKLAQTTSQYEILSEY